MGVPTVPSTPGMAVGDSLLTTVALEEAAIANLVTAEAEKVQRLAATMPDPCTFDEALKMQKTVLAVLDVLVLKEMLLLDKIESVKRLPAPRKCPRPPGFWRTHPEAWTVSALELGCEDYDRDDLMRLLETPPAGNPSVVLVRHLIAAKLNLAGGSGGAPGAAAVRAADELLCESYGRMPCSHVNPEHLRPMLALAHELEDYNRGEPAQDSRP